MPTKITFTIEDDLTQAEIDKLRYLFADALYEFQAPRRDPIAYVQKRYPLQKPDGTPTGTRYVGEKRDEKIAEVSMRTALAEVLRNAILRTLDAKHEEEAPT